MAETINHKLHTYNINTLNHLYYRFSKPPENVTNKETYFDACTLIYYSSEDCQTMPAYFYKSRALFYIFCEIITIINIPAKLSMNLTKYSKTIYQIYRKSFT